MQKSALTFDQLPEFVHELGSKVDQLIALLSTSTVNTQTNEVGGIELAKSITRLSAARIYTLVSERKIPHSKRGNRLTFSRGQLVKWLNEGNREVKGEVVA